MKQRFEAGANLFFRRCRQAECFGNEILNLAEILVCAAKLKNDERGGIEKVHAFSRLLIHHRAVGDLIQFEVSRSAETGIESWLFQIPLLLAFVG
jgi:hypothetical protein